MPAKGSAGKNLLLAAGSVVLVLVLTVAADRTVGRLLTKAPEPGTMELLFPPNSEQHFESSDFTYTAKTNSIGLRDHPVGAKKPGTFRILCIGDSFTYGWGVDIDQTWVKGTEKRLRDKGYDVEIINGGKPGTGPPDFAALAEKAVPVLVPDLLIITILQDDDFAGAGEGVKEPQSGFLDWARLIYPNFVRAVRLARQTRQIAANQQPVTPPQKTSAEDNRRWTEKTAKDFLDKMPPADLARFDQFEEKVKQAFLSGRLNPYMIDLAMKNRNFYTICMNLDDPWARQCIQHLAEQFVRIKRVAANFGARLAVLTIPHGPYVNRAANANIRRVGYESNDDMLVSNAPDESVRIASQRAGLPFMTVMEGFRAHRDDSSLFFELDGHLSASGHALLADLLTPILEKEIPAGAKRNGT